MKIFYDVRQSVSENDSFSPSAQKPALVVESWKTLGLPVEICSFEPCTREQIKLVHDPKYVDGVLDGALRNGFGNTSPAVANALPWVCGSMTSAALYAFEHQVNTFSPTSGAHHAHYGFGHGFCTFNFLVLAALLAHRAGAQKVGIVDCDMHHGDGTEDIIKKCRFKFIQHYSFSLSGRGRSQDDTSFIDDFSESLQEFRDCDLIIYNAGADPHVDDPLGGEMTTEEMRMRDFVLFLCMKKFAIPVVTSLAGGYQRDSQGSIQPVLELHNNTLKECYRVMREY